MLPKSSLPFVLALILALPAYGGEPTSFVEGDDAGDPFSPLITADPSNWTANLIEISGTLGGNDLVDSYCLIIPTSEDFKATTSAADAAGAGADFDTRLFLFDIEGLALMANDDTPSGGLQSTLTHPAHFAGDVVDLPLAPAGGERHILSISAFPLEALKSDDQPIFDLASNFTALVGPDGPEVYDHWSDGNPDPGSYTIVLEGAQVCGYNLAFTTTESGSGDLSTWANAKGATGITAGDEVCQAAAASAFLPNPDSFVAWLSDNNDDALCRAFGLSGKVSSNCDGPSVSDINGSYQRTDGALLGRNLTEISQGRIWRPINHHEDGGKVAPAALIYTGTNSNGTVEPSVTCSDWTSTADSAKAGETSAATFAWTEVSLISCDAQRLIYCFQNGRAPTAPQPRPPAGARLAFLTSATGSGDLSTWPESGGVGGLAGGDAICRSLAQFENLPHASSYKAWLSTSSVHARDRFQSDGPWYRTDGITFAENLNQVSQSMIETALVVHETGFPFAGQFALAFTGTINSGTASPHTCANWSSDALADDGLVGISYYADTLWTDFTPVECQTPRHLYCFADPTDTIFADGFESGDTSAWSISEI